MTKDHQFTDNRRIGTQISRVHDPFAPARRKREWLEQAAVQTEDDDFAAVMKVYLAALDGEEPSPEVREACPIPDDAMDYLIALGKVVQYER